jgi:hypothetical protein
MLIQKIIIKTNLTNEIYNINYDTNGNKFQTKIMGEWDEVAKIWIMKYYFEYEEGEEQDGKSQQPDALLIMYKTGEYSEHSVIAYINEYKYKRVYTLEENDEGNVCLLEEK